MGNKYLKAIETRYKGYRFRSRLEARWAVFFDAAGIPWEYEPEGFDLQGIPYLPDFKIWKDTYVEIKPTLPTNEELEKCKRLCDSLNKDRGTYFEFSDVTELTNEQLNTLDLPVDINELKKNNIPLFGKQPKTENKFSITVLMFCGTPGVPRLAIDKGMWQIGEGSVVLSIACGDLPITFEAFSELRDNVDIWPIYLGADETGVSQIMSCEPGYHQLVTATYPEGIMKRIYIANGCRSLTGTKLQDAYNAARSARFGENGKG